MSFPTAYLIDSAMFFSPGVDGAYGSPVPIDDHGGKSYADSYLTLPLAMSCICDTSFFPLVKKRFHQFLLSCRARVEDLCNANCCECDNYQSNVYLQ